MKKNPRLIAFYLPQYHPIPENDDWWGKGFTEWTNVTKAKPLFPGHYQPHLPADLGYYDLRVPEIRQAQANLAQEYGITGFCYWHYWFAGKRLLERPFREVLTSGQPDFPFCLAWANQSWSGIWHGAPGRVLIEQTYPGIEDYHNHFFSILPAFKDPRYITADSKPIFVIYRPDGLPDPKFFTDYWRELAVQNGLKGIYFIGLYKYGVDYQKDCFDGTIIDTHSFSITALRNKHTNTIFNKAKNKITRQKLLDRVPILFRKPEIYSYKEFVEQGLPNIDLKKDQFPCIIPNWDNTPRSNFRGVVLHNSTPELFRLQLEEAMNKINDRLPDQQIIFIKSWNEWAEGNYIEPDSKFGLGYLETIIESLTL